MRALFEFLTDREIFVLEHHPARSYQRIGEEMGISGERVRQLKIRAERKIREEKRREQVEERGKVPITLTLRRKDIWLILRSLKSYRHELDGRNADQRRKKDCEPDPDIQYSTDLIEHMEKLL